MPNPIGWCHLTTNPITGCGNFGNKKICGDYCYAARMARRLKGRFGYPADDPFRPTFHPEKLKEINWRRDKTPSRIFLNSMSDWFSQGVNPEWIHEVLEAVSKNTVDLFFVLTKRPENLWMLKGFGMESLELPRNLWWGVSITQAADMWRICELVKHLPHVHKFVSFEPLHGPMDSILEDMLDEIEWVIIGAETGNRKGKIWPKCEWVEAILDETARLEIPVFVKNNLEPMFHHQLGSIEMLQQFPGAAQP